MSDWHDLGHGVRATFVAAGNEGELVTIGVMHEHPAVNGEGVLGGGVCSGIMLLDHPENAGRPVWEVTAGDVEAGFDGLTLYPSSLCRACGHHGWITDGRWVPA